MSGSDRRRGVIPSDLRCRLDRASSDFQIRVAARLLAGQLDGVRPSALTGEERGELVELWGAEVAGPALDLLERVGYGAPAPRRPRSERAHGSRRARRLGDALGKLPRSLALRLPTSADTHRTGGNDGDDRWGPVRCSQTLRADHLGVIAAICGLWSSRATAGEDHVDVTASELAQLLTGDPRPGGKDIRRVHELLAQLEALELSAEVRERPGLKGGGSEAHEIPSTPIAAVRRRVGDHLVPTTDYPAAIAAAAEDDAADLVELFAAERADLGVATVRVQLARWVIDALTHPKRRPVYLHFDVWAHLRPSSRRVYAFAQGHGRDDYDGRIYFYLAPQTLYTLGRHGQRSDRAANDVSHDLTALWHADQRYRAGNGFRRGFHAATRIASFACDPARRPSAPTLAALATKSVANRPTCLRSAIAQLRRSSILRARGISQQEARSAGVELAKREAERICRAVLRATATTRTPAALDAPRAGRMAPRGESCGDDEVAAA